jgi:hypothetical protein
VFDYLVHAVALVAREGWRLLDDYRFDPVTGRWRHHEGPVEPPLRLSQLSYDDGGVLRYPEHDDRAPESALAEYLAAGEALLATRAPSGPREPQLSDATVSSEFEHLRWFDLPSVCLSTG